MTSGTTLDGAEPIDKVAHAKTLDEVVAATGEYLSRWSPESLSLIPRRCRPHWIGSAEDIEMYSNQLQTECLRREATGGLASDELQLMRDFFAGASCIITLLKQQGDESGQWAASEKFRWRSPL